LRGFIAVKTTSKNTFLASAAIATLLAVPAQAADMPIKAPALPALTSSWSGFYIGAHVGYGYAVTALNTPALALTSRIIGAGSKGFVAGGLGGYNHMLSSRWVGGIEIDGSWQDIETKVTAANFGGELKGSMDWSASVRARLGFLVTPSMMLFGTAGWTWSTVDINLNAGGFVEQHSGGVSGPQAGFGVETMWTQNWLVRTEYLHSFYDRVEFNTDFLASPVSFSPWVGVIRTALIYKPTSTPTAWPDRTPTAIWSGFYVGGMIGPLMANAKISAPAQGVTVDGGGVSSVVPSFMLGYNFMISPRLLVGVEGEIAPNIATSDVEIEWTGAARLRGGLLVTPNVLAYGTVGWGTSGIKDLTRPELFGAIPIERVHALSVGSGVEAAITDRWRLRADYQRYFTDTITVALPGGGAPLLANVKASAHTARLGASYQFGGP
jgi:outer membrane immunogenic protein